MLLRNLRRQGALRRALTLLAVNAAISAAAQLPRKSPDFAFQTLGGKPVQLSQYRGKAVVLLFILTGCPHCQRTIGILSAEWPRLAPRGLQVLAVAVDAAAERELPGFMKRFTPPFPVGFSRNAIEVLDYMQLPHDVAPSMPLLVLMDKTGVIRAQYTGRDALFQEEKIEANLRTAMDDLVSGRLK